MLYFEIVRHQGLESSILSELFDNIDLEGVDIAGFYDERSVFFAVTIKSGGNKKVGELMNYLPESYGSVRCVRESEEEESPGVQLSPELIVMLDKEEKSRVK